MCSTVQEQITTCGQNAIVKIGERTNIRPQKHAICLKDYGLQSCLSIQYVHGDLCNHLGIDSSTDHSDRYSNLFLNAYINRHVHAEYLK